MTTLFINNISDLKEFNNISFYKFLKTNLKKKITELPNPLFLTEDEELEFNFYDGGLMSFEYFKTGLFIKNFNTTETFDDSATFNLEMYAPYELIKFNKYNKINVKAGLAFIGEFPLLTSNCTYFINNSERILINQIIRRPGVYFQQNDLITENPLITIITEKGLCIKLNIKKEIVLEPETIQIEEIPEITDFNLFLPSISFIDIIDIEKNEEKEEENKFITFSDLESNLKKSKDPEGDLKLIIKDSKNTIKLNKQTKDSASLNILQSKTIKNIINKNDPNSPINNPDLFLIGKSGRNNLNKKLNLNLPLTQEFVTNKDFFEIFKLATLTLDKFDDEENFDLYENKKIRSLELFLEQIVEKNFSNYRKVLVMGYIILHKKIKKKIITKFINDALEGIKNSFLEISTLQFADQVNSLSTLSQLRRITVFGQEGAIKNNIPKQLNNIQFDQYGRICPIETVDGKDAGLITNLAFAGRINNFGEIEQPYFLNLNDKKEKPNSLLFLNSEEEKGSLICFCPERSNLEYVFARKEILLVKTQKKNLNYLFFSPLQMFSLAIALIPFLEHNELGRMQMAASMEKQAVPLLFSKASYIGSNFENIIAASSGFALKSYFEGIVNYISSSAIECVDQYNQKIIYPLLKNIKLNQKGFFFFKPSVWTGEKIFSNQIIAYGPGFDYEEVALGQNLIVSYLPWEGYNYEDGILISDRLITEDYLTSLHISEYEEELKTPSYIKTLILSNANVCEKIVEIRYVNNDSVNLLLDNSETIRIYTVKTKRIQIGDKLAGRYGNKGVITKILSNYDMPYLDNDIQIDLIFNPLGIPSRMNLGQLYESLLAFASNKLNTKIKMWSFNEFSQHNSSEIIVKQALKNVVKFKNKNWYFNPNLLGKFDLVDGQSGLYYDNCAVVGKNYILKLIHLVSEKYHSRNSGKYFGVLEQVTQGKQKYGGQRFGEMETWALEAHGSFFSLQEALTLKADSTNIRKNFDIFLNKKNDYSSALKIDSPVGFVSFIRELNSIGLSIDLINFKNF